MAIGVIIATAGGAIAANTSVTALLANQVKFNFDGVLKSVPAGFSVLNYEGRIYVPARFVAEELGAEVGWDADSQTVLINESGKPVAADPARGSPRFPAEKGQELSIDVKTILHDYNATVSLKEWIRGEEAWTKIKKANIFNNKPKEGHEYILAKLSFKVNRSKDKEKQVSISGYSFTLVSEEGKDYPNVFTIAPEPQLDAHLYAGSSTEGWAVFEVKTDDQAPLITFGRTYDGKGGVWFKAYE